MATLNEAYGLQGMAEQAKEDIYRTARIGHGVPTQSAPVFARIGELSQHVAEAAGQLAEARERYSEAARQKEKAEATFVEVSNRLMQAIQEHREGTPEGVPYGLRAREV